MQHQSTERADIVTPNSNGNLSPRGLPEVDVSALVSGAVAPSSAVNAVANQISAATSSTGFFYLAGHGIRATTINNVINAGRLFFDAGDAVKLSIAIDQNNRGYLAPGEAQMYGAAKKDLKEVFFFGRELDDDDPDLLARVPLCAANKWPPTVPQLRTAIVAYCTQIATVGNALLRAFAVSLGREQTYFEPFYQRPLQRGQLIHYPSPSGDAPRDQFGVAEHSDFGCLTLLYQHSPGLEVKRPDQSWLPVEPRPDRLVVNIGDLLERWTAGRLPSTRHRVRNQTGTSRYSLAIFLDPSPDAIIDPHDLDPNLKLDATHEDRYAPVTASDYILDRSRGVFAQFKN